MFKRSFGAMAREVSVQAVPESATAEHIPHRTVAEWGQAENWIKAFRSAMNGDLMS
jgi:hypothetical protein